jgi:hypothetical protein
MAISAKKGSFTTTAATGALAITGVGFQGKALLMWASESDAGFDPDSVLAFGAATSSSERYALCSASTDGAAAPSNNRRVNASAIVLMTGGGVVEYEADFTSWGSDGFTLNVLTGNAAGWVIHWMVLGGADLTNAKVLDQFTSTSLGTQSFTGYGFQPDFLLMFGRNSTAVTGTTTGWSAHFGFANAALEQAAVGHRVGTVSPTLDGTIQVANRCWYTQAIDTDGSFLNEATIVSMDADGWTWNMLTTFASQLYFITLALKGASTKITTDTQKTSTGTQAKTGIGFLPAGLLFFSTNRASSASQSTTVGKTTIGGTDGTSQGTVWASDTDNVATVESKCTTSTSKVLVMATNPSTVNAEAGISAVGSDGYTLDWTTADGTARESVVVAFGSAAAAPSSPVRVLPMRSRGTSW